MIGHVRSTNMSGKIVVVTGANSGIGLETASQLAALGAEIVMVCRNEARGRAAEQRVADTATGPKPTLLIADLLSQSSILALSRELHARYDRIDVLVNNAGAMFARRELSVDGIEKTWAGNHLAPFLLTNLLLDRLQAAPRARIVTVSSESHSGSLDFDSLQGERKYNFFVAYNRSKLGNILFTYELARRLAGTRATANAVSPGPTKTTFGSEMRGLPSLFPLIMMRIPFLFQDAATGARTSVYAASSPELDDVSGRFFLKERARRTRSITYDVEVARKLWHVSEEMCGLSAVAFRRARA
jgi:NAD(P)-dependent dehydrogenase (short-subunit alcohol dehydrogenase family)